MKEEIGPKLVIEWRYFSLEQVNNQHGPHWNVWEQPEGYASRGLYAFWAAEAARHQSVAAFEAFHMALLRAKHQEHCNIADLDTLVEVAQSADLDMTRFRHDLTDPALLTKLAEDHTFAVNNLGVFGTPTLVFGERQVIFLKMSAPPPPEESLSVFAEIHHLADRRRYIHEIKRPPSVK